MTLHMIKWSRNHATLCVVAQYLKPSTFEFGNHEPCRNRDITTVSYDHCGCWSSFIRHHAVELGGHRPRGSRSITFFLITWPHVTMWSKGHRTLYHLVKLGWHKSRRNRDITFFICHVTITLLSLVVIGLADVEIEHFLFIKWPHGTMWSKGHRTLYHLVKLGWHTYVSTWSTGYVTFWIKSFIQSYFSVKFISHRPRESENITFFICQVIARLHDQRLTRLCRRWSFTSTQQPVNCGGHKSCGSRDIICVGRKVRK